MFKVIVVLDISFDGLVSFNILYVVFLLVDVNNEVVRIVWVVVIW